MILHLPFTKILEAQLTGTGDETTLDIYHNTEDLPLRHKNHNSHDYDLSLDVCNRDEVLSLPFSSLLQLHRLQEGR
jgi:hypothetical protein